MKDSDNVLYRVRTWIDLLVCWSVYVVNNSSKLESSSKIIFIIYSFMKVHTICKDWQHIFDVLCNMQEWWVRCNNKYKKTKMKWWEWEWKWKEWDDDRNQWSALNEKSIFNDAHRFWQSMNLENRTSKMLFSKHEKITK